MNALTLEVILQVVFGVTDERRLRDLRPLVNRTVDVSPAVFLGWGFPRLQRFGPWRKAFENQAALDRVIYAEIADRRTATDLEQRTDVLSRLLLAGHETTATALAWTLHELARDPVQEQRARDAATSGDHDHLEAVLKESMRLHPVIPMVVRHLMAPATIGGIDLPAGANVAASIILAHASESSHPDHTAFRPERFLEGQVAANTWIPFGGGVRRCIGAGFSLMEGVAVLREVLTTYDVRLPAGAREVPKVRNITSLPKHGARIVVTRR
jgi:cytochrome P450